MDFQIVIGLAIGSILGYHFLIKKKMGNNEKASLKTDNQNYKTSSSKDISNLTPSSKELNELELEFKRNCEKDDLKKLIGGNRMFERLFHTIDLDLIELMPSRIEDYSGGAFGKSLSKECFLKVANRIRPSGIEYVVYQLDIGDQIETKVFDKISVLYYNWNKYLHKDYSMELIWPSLQIELELSKITEESKEKFLTTIRHLSYFLGNPIDSMNNIIDIENINSYLIESTTNNGSLYLDWDNLDLDLNDLNGEPLKEQSVSIFNYKITIRL